MPPFLSSVASEVPLLRNNTVRRMAKVLKITDLVGIPEDLPECPGSRALREALVEEYLRSQVHAAPMQVVEVQGMVRLRSQ